MLSLKNLKVLVFIIKSKSFMSLLLCKDAIVVMITEN